MTINRERILSERTGLESIRELQKRWRAQDEEKEEAVLKARAIGLNEGLIRSLCGWGVVEIPDGEKSFIFESKAIDGKSILFSYNAQDRRMNLIIRDDKPRSSDEREPVRLEGIPVDELYFTPHIPAKSYVVTNITAIKRGEELDTHHVIFLTGRYKSMTYHAASEDQG